MYLENPVVTPRVSVMKSRHAQHFAFHLFSARSTTNSLYANFTISGGFTGLVLLLVVLVPSSFLLVLQLELLLALLELELTKVEADAMIMNFFY